MSLTAADVTEAEETAGANTLSVNNSATESTEPPGSSPSHETEAAQGKPSILDGALVDDAANVYGCGREHTQEVNGIRFHWYDRYEHRNKDNTMIFSSIDILTFKMRYTIQENSIDQNDIWYIDYEINVSSEFGAKLR